MPEPLFQVKKIIRTQRFAIDQVWPPSHRSEYSLKADPLAGVKCPNADADRRHERRALLPEEWQWLEAVTRLEPRR